jgi:hypothetical protein
MTANTMTQTTAKKPCGCGGSGGGHSGSDADVREAADVMRVLPDADLQSSAVLRRPIAHRRRLAVAGDYVVAKNWPHSRYLFGDGVVWDSP